MILFIKGFLCGVFNIIPGLSGSSLLVVMGIYEKCLYYVSSIFRNFKKSFLYLFPVFLGIVLGTVLFSGVILYMINNYVMGTSIVFAFLVFGMVPSLVKRTFKYGVKLSYFISFFASFFIGVMLLFYKSNYIVSSTNLGFFGCFMAGVLVSISTIIPGISSTVLLSIFGMYGTYISALSSVCFRVLIPMGLGFVVCFFLLSKLVSYLIRNYYGYTFFGILGFTISTIPGLFMTRLYFCSELVIGFVIGILAFFVTVLSFRNME